MDTWIYPSSSSSNGSHCIKFLYNTRELLLDLVPCKPLSLVKMLLCFENPIKLYFLLALSLHLGVHDIVHCGLLNAFRVELHSSLPHPSKKCSFLVMIFWCLPMCFFSGNFPFYSRGLDWPGQPVVGARPSLAPILN